MRIWIVVLMVLLLTIPALAVDNELVIKELGESTVTETPVPAVDAPAAAAPIAGTVSAENKAAAALAINNFSWSIYQNLMATEKGNLFLSPFSISTALTMTLAGAASETRVAMGKALKLPETDSTIIAAIAAIADDLNQAGAAGDFALSVANALYGEKTYAFKQTYIDFLKNIYHAPLTQVDYIHAAEEARKMINTWVEDKTAQKIKNLIPEGILDELTRLVLVNAIYFKGSWLSQFKVEATRDADFTLADGSKKTVKMMVQNQRVPYLDAGDFQAVRLPYKGERLSMVVLLPAAGKDLHEFAAGMTAERFTTIINDMAESKLDLYLPRFKVETGASLKPVLEKLGMAVAFTDSADFSEMTAKNDLKITAVIHKAFVQVNEEGTEAAAATAVVVGIKSISMPLEFRADHPFLFAIVDNPTGAVLFLGNLMEPAE